MTTAATPKTATEQCPWCGSTISHDRFLRVQSKIREEEKRKMEALRRQLEQKSQRDVAEAKKEAAQNAEKKLASMKNERNEARRQVKVAKADAEKVRQKVTDELAKTHRQELIKQRGILEKDRDRQVRKKDSEFAREREAYQKKISDLDRRLKNKTANELGEGAELDLYEVLREAFPDDDITRIGKGKAGADIKHVVMQHSDPCGSLVIDSKNRKAWQTAFATKLREDQIQAEADYGILSSSVFPSGKKEICEESGVLVVGPARVVEIVRLLRAFLIKLHRRTLSDQERAGKMEAIYKYLTSDAFDQRFGELSDLAGELLEIDVKEQDQHRKVWKKRGHLLRRQQNALGDIDAEISAILESSRSDDDSCPF